jgi:nicotinamide-nucleotide amidase
MARRRPAGPQRLVVIAVGDELLNGFVVNSNAAWLGRCAADAGAQVVEALTVRDDAATIARAVTEACAIADVVVLSGGLGPTSDDRTREGLAVAAGVPIELNAAAEAVLRDLLDRQGRIATAELLRQVELPQGATPIPNSAGSAPGVRLQIDGTVVIALPGPPRELRAVAEAGLVPELRSRRGSLVTLSLRTALLPESEVAALVGPLEPRHPEVAVAYLAAPAEVVVRLSASGADPDELGAVIDRAAEDVREVLGDAVVGDADRSLAEEVVGLLARVGRTVAVAESLTGGAVAAAFTDVPGASEVLRGGVVAYATASKASVLGVDETLLAEHGPVHAGVAREMAVRVREMFGADYGVATTGVAGPDPQGDVPVGVVHVAVAGPRAVTAVRRQLHGDRDVIRRQVTVAALDLVRRGVLGLPPRTGAIAD